MEIGGDVGPNPPRSDVTAPHAVRSPLPTGFAERPHGDRAPPYGEPVSATLTNVTPRNVLKARAAILAEAESLQEFVRQKFSTGSLIGLCGGDPISRDAQQLFTAKIHDNVLTPTYQYIDRLLDIAEELAASARAYGFTEEQIAGSFRPAGTVRP